MRYYKMHLQRRLILELSSDQEKEETMINRLRVRVLLHVLLWESFLFRSLEHFRLVRRLHWVLLINEAARLSALSS